jgi:tRNA nucleotidyltransferase/poly(A) polymerase
VRRVAGRAPGRRGLALTAGFGIRRAFGTLMRRADVRAAASLARPGDAVRAVGGAVRDAFLKRRGGDLDLVVRAGGAERFAEELAAHLGTRVIAVGAAPKRVLRIPFRAKEIDVWEEDGNPEADLLRRDFTVNALSFSLPDGAFSSVPGALADLEAKRLVPPRPGVFLEDPLRVLRAARFLAEMPQFHVARRAMPELRVTGRFLRMVAGERILGEMGRLLSAPSRDAARALRFLERLGALEALLQGTAARERRRGISLVGRMKTPSPRVARALLLSPVGEERAVDFLRRWRTSREEQRLASRLFALPLRARGAPTRRSVAAFLRLVSPFEEESTTFLLAAGNSRARDMARAARRVLHRPAALRRILKPVRPLQFAEISSLLHLPEGPPLGRALDAFDLALAAGEVRGARAARAWLNALRRRRVSFDPQVT